MEGRQSGGGCREQTGPLSSESGRELLKGGVFFFFKGRCGREEKEEGEKKEEDELSKGEMGGGGEGTINSNAVCVFASA